MEMVYACIMSIFCEDKKYCIYLAIRGLVYKTRGMFWPLRERILLGLAYKTGLNFCKFPTSRQCLHVFELVCNAAVMCINILDQLPHCPM